jgi:hypothetical protein
MITIVISNDTSGPMDNPTGVISFDFPEIKMVRSIVQTDGKTVTGAEARRRVRIDGDHKISIRPLKLGKGQYFRVVIITSGKCEKPAVECKDFIPDHAALLRLETNEIMEQNLAQMEPRLLLSNQRIYQQWHKLLQRHPWLKSLPALNKGADQDSET